MNIRILLAPNVKILAGMDLILIYVVAEMRVLILIVGRDNKFPLEVYSCLGENQFCASGTFLRSIISRSSGEHAIFGLPRRLRRSTPKKQLIISRACSDRTTAFSFTDHLSVSSVLLTLEDLLLASCMSQSERAELLKDDDMSDLTLKTFLCV